MIFVVGLTRVTKKGDERYRTVYAEAISFEEAERKVIEEQEENENLAGFTITTISKESDINIIR